MKPKLVTSAPFAVTDELVPAPVVVSTSLPPTKLALAVLLAAFSWMLISCAASAPFSVAAPEDTAEPALV